MAITHFGRDNSTAAHQNDMNVKQGGIAACAEAEANKPGLLRLDAVNDSGTITSYYLWMDSNGKLRVHNAIPTDQDNQGSIIGP